MVLALQEASNFLQFFFEPGWPYCSDLLAVLVVHSVNSESSRVGRGHAFDGEDSAMEIPVDCRLTDWASHPFD